MEVDIVSEHEANILSRMRDGLMLMPSDLGGVELDAFKMLIRKRWVTQGLSDDGRYRISLLGREALLAHEQQLDRLRDQAQHEAQQDAQRREAEKRAARRSWRQFWLGLLLGWVLGGFTARELVEYVVSLFHR